MRPWMGGGEGARGAGEGGAHVTASASRPPHSRRLTAAASQPPPHGCYLSTITTSTTRLAFTQAELGFLAGPPATAFRICCSATATTAATTTRSLLCCL